MCVRAGALCGVCRSSDKHLLKPDSESGISTPRGTWSDEAGVRCIGYFVQMNFELGKKTKGSVGTVKQIIYAGEPVPPADVSW